MHILCTICSDLVNQAENIFVTKCGHIFHYHCLAQWIERSKSCPQCRNKVTERCMFRLYPTVSNESSGDDAATLQSRLDDAQLQLRQQKASCKEKDDKLNMLHTDLKRNEDLLRSYEKKLVSRDSAVSALKEQLECMKIQNKETKKLKEENESLKKNIEILESFQKILNATTKEAEVILQGYPDMKTLALFATALKKGLCEAELKKNEFRDKLHAHTQQIAAERSNALVLQTKIQLLEERLSNVVRKYESLKKRKASEMADKSPTEEVVKQPRKSDSIDLNTAILGDSDSSLNSMVSRIENAESPYLNLKQSSLALSALRVPTNSPENKQKHSDFEILNAARSHAFKEASRNAPLSIFYKKPPLKHDPDIEMKAAQMNIFYDGLGGHSKLDIFPTPKQKPTFKSCVPKLTAKHKLKRPSAPSGSQDIGKLLQSLNK